MSSLATQAGSLGRSIWIFLARARFGLKAPADERWILLDFLGFSRLNRAFSMGYTGFSPENFFSALFPGLCLPDWQTTDLERRKRKTVHGASIPCFRFFLKQLSPTAFAFGRLPPGANCPWARKRSEGAAPSSGAGVGPPYAAAPIRPASQPMMACLRASPQW
jgi:hypothetical protein